MRRRALAFVRRRRVWVTLQLVFVALVLAFLGYFLRDAWADALPRLRDASLVDVGIALAVLTTYYLLFVVGWQWLLAALGVRVGYWLALQAEMASMLAKYVPGGVWTPLARILWLRRAGVERTAVVLSSILLEAGLSALSGVLVFAVGLLFVGDADAPLAALVAFAAIVAVLIHPRVYLPLARWVFRRLGNEEPILLPYRTMAGLLVFYSGTWLVGGLAVFFLLRSVGGDPALSDVPYLGGTAAVGAIVAVLSIVAPSGLGVREGSMYGLLLAVASEGVALGATVLNRLAITIVEALLLGYGVLGSRLRRSPDPAVLPVPEPAPPPR
jgi:glycosyltransferase 2 family protein